MNKGVESLKANDDDQVICHTTKTNTTFSSESVSTHGKTNASAIIASRNQVSGSNPSFLLRKNSQLNYEFMIIIDNPTKMHSQEPRASLDVMQTNIPQFTKTHQTEADIDTILFFIFHRL